MNEFKLTVFAADKPFYEGNCISLEMPTSEGQYGIWANHSDMIAAIVPGLMKVTLPDNTEKVAAVSGGIAEVSGNSVLVLVDTLEKPEEIDENRAKRAREQAKEAMLQKRSRREYYAAQARMARAMSRINVKEYENHGK